MEDEGEVEVCVISKGPPILHPFTITMATVITSSHQGSCNETLGCYGNIIWVHQPTFVL